MLTLTVSREEFAKHLKDRCSFHQDHLANVKKLLKELRDLVKKIKSDMKKSSRKADKILRVKGHRFSLLITLGIVEGDRGPQGPQGSQGPCGEAGDTYADFTSETQLLDRLESKERELGYEMQRTLVRLGQFDFYRKHLGQEVYELTVSELAALEFTGS